MPEPIQSLLTAANNDQSLLANYGMIIILVAITAEGFGIPLPGQSLLIAGALLSARGEFDIRVLLVLSWLAALGGSTLGYIIGRAGGRKLRLRLPLSAIQIARMDTFCQRYGTLLVTLSRFIDGPRQLTGIFVGSLHMSAIRFFLASSVGAVLWVGFWGLGSYYFGEHIHIIAQASAFIAPYSWFITGLLLLVLCAYLIRKHHHHKSTSDKRQG